MEAASPGNLVRLATPAEARRQADEWRRQGLTIGLVPTMGALHAGHRSLIDRARADNDRVVVSIFVNPLQFGPSEDFQRYPRRLPTDLEMAQAAGADAVYMPAVESMYPPGFATTITVRGVSEPLEGAHRPGHFDGVATVVHKLFDAMRPHRAYFGQKDAQQVAVVRQMAADLDTGVEIVVCPIVREADGLALSSRNAYLAPDERRAALVLSRSLRATNDEYLNGERNLGVLAARLRAELASEPLAQVDYADLVDPDSFREPGPLAVVAVRIGSTRLIDNHRLGDPF